MNGFQIVAYGGDPYDEDGFSPAHADTIIKSWAATREKERKEKRRMEAEYGGRVIIR